MSRASTALKGSIQSRPLRMHTVEHGPSRPDELPNLVSPAEVSVNRVGRALDEITGKRRFVYADRRKGNVRHTVADSTKAQTFLDCSPRPPFQERTHYIRAAG